MKSPTLTELLEVCRKATPGPWERGSAYTASIMGSDGQMVADTLCAQKRRDITGKKPNDNAAFIAALNPARAIQLIEALMKAVDALKRVVIQILPEEYEGECGDEMDADTMAEAYELIILEARAALAAIEGK